MHYNGSNRFLFVNAVKICPFKPKDLEIKLYSLCLGNISKDFTLHNLKITVLKGSIKVFSVDYNATDTNDILHIQIYLM